MKEPRGAIRGVFVFAIALQTSFSAQMDNHSGGVSMSRASIAAASAILLAYVGQSTAQQLLPHHIDVSSQQISKASANAIFAIKKKLEADGIDHREYDFYIRVEPDFISVAVNYRTDGEGRVWNTGIRGCSARGRAPCMVYQLNSKDFRIISARAEPQ
jgi:uncharacterized DUF497 family protein